MIQLLENIDQPKIFFTPEAWLKMTAMVDTTESQECALEGTVYKDDNCYTVLDVFAYPQIIASTTVTTDDDAYNKWLSELPDEVINTKRFQMHSHVNMSVSPSGVDLGTYEKYIQATDDYMIFMIMNRKHEFNIYLYDVLKGLKYDTESIDVGILLDDEHSTYDWYLKEFMPMMKKKATVVTKKKGSPTYDYDPYDYKQYFESY